MKKFWIYKIDTNYIDWLLRFDPNILWPKINSYHERPYVGILINVNDYLYFAPLTHKGFKWLGYEDHVVIKNGIYGAICLNNMIPLKPSFVKDLITKIDFKSMIRSNDITIKQYGLLLQNQYRWINKKGSYNKILKKASLVYFCSRLLDKKAHYICNFHLLEMLADRWESSYKYSFIKTLLNNWIYSK